MNSIERWAEKVASLSQWQGKLTAPRNAQPCPPFPMVEGGGWAAGAGDKDVGQTLMQERNMLLQADLTQLLAALCLPHQAQGSSGLVLTAP